MTVRESLTEVSKLSPAERVELERLWRHAFADELRQRRLAELRDEIQTGLSQLDSGRYSEITDRTLSEVEAEALREAPPRRNRG